MDSNINIYNNNFNNNNNVNIKFFTRNSNDYTHIYGPKMSKIV